MTDTPIEKVLNALEKVTGKPAIRNGKGWKANCPAHDDKNPSLSITEGSDGRALIRCFAGCHVEGIVSAIGLELRDLMPDGPGPKGPRPRPRTKSGPTPIGATMMEIVAELERKRGKVSTIYEYHDGHGEPVGAVLRWNRDNGEKDILPIRRDPDGWRLGAMPEPRPLYQLHTLGDADLVYVVEGEKSADAAGELGFTATTSPGGSQAAHKADWKAALHGKRVTILPDADGAGAKYAQAVSQILVKHDPDADVRIVELPGLPPHGDIVEFIAAHGPDDARRMIEELAAAAPRVVRETRPPVNTVKTEVSSVTVRRCDPYIQFPVEVLPSPLREFVTAGAHTFGCDAALFALPLLTAAAAAIGNTRRIQLRRSWTEPPILWAVVIAESGGMKTPALDRSLKPLRNIQNAAFKEHAAQMAEYEVQRLQYEKDMQTWKRSRGGGDPPTKPEPPEAVRYIVSDATVEALAPLLLANPRGVLLSRDELRGWLDFDRYSGSRGGSDESAYLSMHNALPLTVDRKTGAKLIYVPSAAVSICGGIQPGILQRAMGPEHRESGLLARCLLAWPPRRSKRWTDADIEEHVEDRVVDVFNQLVAMDFAQNAAGDPEPIILTMTAKAKTAWIEFYNAHAAEQAELTGDLAAAWSKLEAYGPRLALVTHSIRQAAGDPTLDGDRVDEASILAGIQLSRWFGHEARRIYAALGESEADRENRQLVEWIRERGGSVTPRDMVRGLNRYKNDTEAAKLALDALAEGGFGKWGYQSPGSAGGRQAARFVLHDPTDATDTDKTPTDDTENRGCVGVGAVGEPESTMTA